MFVPLILQVIPWVPLVLRSVRWTLTLTWRIWAEGADRSALLWWVRRVRPALRKTRWVPEWVWTWADWFQRPSRSRPSVPTRRKPAQKRSQISKTICIRNINRSIYISTIRDVQQENKCYVYIHKFLKVRWITLRIRRFWLSGELIWPLSDLMPFFLELRSMSFHVLADMNWMFI